MVATMVHNLVLFLEHCMDEAIAGSGQKVDFVPVTKVGKMLCIFLSFNCRLGPLERAHAVDVIQCSFGTIFAIGCQV